MTRKTIWVVKIEHQTLVYDDKEFAIKAFELLSSGKVQKLENLDWENKFCWLGDIKVELMAMTIDVYKDKMEAETIKENIATVRRTGLSPKRSKGRRKP